MTQWEEDDCLYFAAPRPSRMRRLRYRLLWRWHLRRWQEIGATDDHENEGLAVGHQIIKQPDGKLAVFSSVTDTWILMDATAADLEDYYAERAAEDARRSTRRVLEDVLAGEPRKAYCQFDMTFEEANRSSRESGAEWWSDGGWVSTSGS